MAIFAVRVAQCFALAAAANSGGVAKERTRKFDDAEVIASQRPFLDAWRDKFNKGDADYCGGAYLDDAALMVRLGPAAPVWKAALKNPAGFHGRTAITDFWHIAIDQLGLKDVPEFGEGDEPYAFAVDDDTVIISGPIKFGTAANGSVLSETWVRVNDVWRIRSDLLTIENADLVQLEALMEASRARAATAAAELASAESQGPAAETQAPAKVAPGPPTIKKAWTTTTAKLVASDKPPPQAGEQASATGPSKPAEMVGTQLTTPPPSSMPVEKGASILEKEEPSAVAFSIPTDTSKPSGGGMGPMLFWGFLVGVVFFVAFFIYRSSRRKSRMIGGPENLLG